MIALILLSWLIIICFVIATIETQSNGFFLQKRIGQYGKLFSIIKIRTIHPKTHEVTSFGRYFRELKLDELPQFFNVLKGDMSIVGPRPDVPGYYDLLQGENREILSLKPGITSDASLKYKNEDEILRCQEKPIEYNDQVIFPDKVKMNLAYVRNRTILGDLNIIMKTIFSFFNRN